MSLQVIGGTRIWLYTATGVVPSQVPEAQIEGWVRAAVSWNDTILAHLRGTVVETKVLDPAELARLLGGTHQ